MTLPLYLDNHPAPNAMPDGGHRGLWYERFFNAYDDQWQVPAEGKAQWVKSNAKRAGDGPSLEEAVQRQLELVTTLGGRGAVFAADWHFATGLGLPHPVENGLAWHHTLGVPYLAGSAVKGLVRAWVEVWDDSLDDEQRQQRLATWFGSLDQAGAFLFFDALPIAPVNLRADVMTPHMGKWYEQGGEIQDWRHEPDKVPADWHAPVPVPFLVASKPQLLFGIAPRHPDLASELDAVFKALKQALDWLGAGAKTAVGYGQMQENESGTRQLYKDQEQREQKTREAAETRRREAERLAERERLDPFERTLLDLIDARPDKNQSEIVYLIGQVKSGRWQGEERQRVAHWLEARMKATKGQWKPQSQAKKPDKDRDYQNTLLVLQWLKG
ncbi:CRISPR-associated RAMP protein, Cmr6 family [Thiorhodococcus drewsii AZ1]|uniref:CRISPR-associated RAMP protein, Cmr6 family n=1 Tax=Thiorhodococcus drewsii AZ1 TaxID=765913 RepID=G2DYK3_9GAMM|nr:type III-B CRISPR module RAMP protein Cmr6 [Thiorhodococcus drewsii]EGV32630.1 CRISPR-associated RAMP protein, Cmr6 family [Thiorhodococcus drewsii AZ1]